MDAYSMTCAAIRLALIRLDVHEAGACALLRAPSDSQHKRKQPVTSPKLRCVTKMAEPEMIFELPQVPTVWTSRRFVSFLTLAKRNLLFCDLSVTHFMSTTNVARHRDGPYSNGSNATGVIPTVYQTSPQKVTVKKVFELTTMSVVLLCGHIYGITMDR